MALWLGSVEVDGNISIPFSTHTAAGANVAPLSAFEIDDIRVYKGSSATQRSSTSGMTMTSPFDSLTGFHMIEIDLSDNTDAGFWATTNIYHVVLAPDSETVDGQTITAVHLASFGIQWGSYDDILTRLGAPSNLGSGASLAKNMVDIEGQTDDIGAAGAGLTAITGKLPAALVSGRIDASVGAMAAAVVTAAAIATGAIDADALAADAIDEILDEVIEGSTTLRQAIRLMLATLIGKANGGGTTTINFRDIADSKNRVTATVDSSGNRSAVTLDAS